MGGSVKRGQHCFPSPPRAWLTWTPGEHIGLSQHFSSFVRLHTHSSFPTPAGFLSGSDSLPESGFYLRGKQGKRYQVIPPKGDNPSAFLPLPISAAVYHWQCQAQVILGCPSQQSTSFYCCREKNIITPCYHIPQGTGAESILFHFRGEIC